MRAVTLHLMVLSMFVEGVGIGPVSVGRIVVVLAIFVAVMQLLHTRTFRAPHPAVLVPAGLLSAWMVLSRIWATEHAAWLEATLELALALGFFFAYAVLIDSRERVRQLLMTLVVGAVLMTFVGLVQLGQDARAVGLQGDPNTYALYELAAIPLVVVLGWRSRGARRLMWGVASALLLAAVFSSQSRGALLGLAVVLGWLTLLENDRDGVPRRDIRVLAGVVLALLLAGIMSLFPRLAPARVLEDRGTGRLDIWLAAWSAWQEQPVLGLGAGNFEARSGDLLSQTPGVQLDPYSVMFDGIRVHNAYLEPLVELGPVGLAAFLALLTGTVLLLQRDRRRHPEDLIALLVPVFMVYATTTIFLSTMNNKLLWLLVGIASVLPYLPETARPEAAPRSRAMEDA